MDSRLRRTIALGAICLAVSALGMFLARPLAQHLQRLPPWVLPALAVAVLAVLVCVALLVLPGLGKPRA